MTAANRDWMLRMQKRNELAVAMLKRPSQSEASEIQSSNSTSGEAQRMSSPTSPNSSHSAGTSSLGSIEEALVLEMQFKKNEAQIEANKERMRQLQAADDRIGRDIQERMSAVMQLNRQLSFMRDMIARAERVSKGDFGVPSDGL